MVRSTSRNMCRFIYYSCWTTCETLATRCMVLIMDSIVCNEYNKFSRFMIYFQVTSLSTDSPLTGPDQRLLSTTISERLQWCIQYTTISFQEQFKLYDISPGMEQS